MGWIIHYKDGKSLAETQDLEWKDISKENVTSLQVSHKGIVHTLVVPKGYLGVFQHKVGWAFLGRPELDEPVSDRQVGVVINSKGDCIILSVDEKTGHARTFIDNIERIKLNKELHNIKLER